MSEMTRKMSVHVSMTDSLRWASRFRCEICRDAI